MSVENKIKELEERLARLEREISEIKSKITPKEVIEEISVEAIRKKLIEQSEEFKEGFVMIAGYAKNNRWEMISTPKNLLDLNPKKIATFCESLSNECRVKILKALYDGTKTSSELSKITGLEGGQLYHHLRILIQNRLISVRRRGEYQITGFGIQALLVLSLMSGVIIPPLEEEIKELM